MKTWFITGVSSGLGRALAIEVLARGDRVWGTVRSRAAQAAFLDLEPHGAAGASLAEMADPASVEAAVEEAQAGFGEIDVLVNNAGYGIMGAVEEVSVAEAQAQFAANLFGPLAAIQAVLPRMRARGRGHVVNITSVSGLAAWAGTGIYCASKFALEGQGMTLAEEVAPLGIHVHQTSRRAAFAPTMPAAPWRARLGWSPPTRPPPICPNASSLEHLGQEPNDPAKAGRAILAAVDADPPPRHLLLGADALRYASRYMAALQTDMGQWAELSTSVAAAEALTLSSLRRGEGS